MTTATNTRTKARTLKLTPELLVGIRKAAAVLKMTEVCFCRAALREYFKVYNDLEHSDAWAAWTARVTLHPCDGAVSLDERFEGRPVKETISIDAETDCLLMEREALKPTVSWTRAARRALLRCSEAAVWGGPEIANGFSVELRKETRDEIETQRLMKSLN